MKANLLVRSLSAIVFVIVIAAAVFINQYLQATVFGLIAGIVLYEYLKLKQSLNDFIALLYPLILGLGIYAVTFLHAIHLASAKIFFIIPPLFILILMASLFKTEKKTSPQQLIFSILYAILPFSALIYLTNIGENDYSPVYLVALFAFLWLNDSGAYLIGSMIGKHKLFERISPKKTWEGTLGGLLVVLIGAYFFNDIYPELSRIEWIGFGLLTGIFGTYGDLYESLEKRKSGVKDSGKIMPGHGGLLDRFDSLLFAAPIILSYLFLINKF